MPAIELVAPADPVAAGSLVVVQVATPCEAVLVEVLRDGRELDLVECLQLAPAPGVTRWVFTGPEGRYVVRVVAAGPGLATRRAVVTIRSPAPRPDDPPPTPPPSPVAGVLLLLLEETADRARIPRGQLDVLTSMKARAEIEPLCAVGPDGRTRELRVLDDDTPMNTQGAAWQAAMQRAKGTAGFRTPWLYATSGGREVSVPLPESVAGVRSALGGLAK